MTVDFKNEKNHVSNSQWDQRSTLFRNTGGITNIYNNCLVLHIDRRLKFILCAITTCISLIYYYFQHPIFSEKFLYKIKDNTLTFGVPILTSCILHQLSKQNSSKKNLFIDYLMKVFKKVRYSFYFLGIISLFFGTMFDFYYTDFYYRRILFIVQNFLIVTFISFLWTVLTTVLYFIFILELKIDLWFVTFDFNFTKGVLSLFLIFIGFDLSWLIVDGAKLLALFDLFAVIYKFCIKNK